MRRDIMLVTLDVSPAFLEKNAHMINWTDFSYTNDLTDEILSSAVAKHLDWDVISSTINLYNMEMLETCADRLDWNTITFRSINTDLLCVKGKFMSRFARYLDWAYITRMHPWTAKFVNAYADLIHWNIISYRRFTIPMFKKHHKLVNWERLVVSYNLSASELIALRDYIPWDLVARYQDLSESDIEQMGTLINWADVAEYQAMSLSFLAKHKDAFPLNRLRSNKHLRDVMPQVLEIFGVAPVVFVESESDDACPICRQHETSKRSALVCGHAFHTECIADWTAISRTCPLCRIAV